MAALYTVLVEADASKQTNEEKKTPPKKLPKPQNKTARAKDIDPIPPKDPPANQSSNPGSSNPPAGPGININLEIHISADASADQIDLIFAAMAKHIYKRV